MPHFKDIVARSSHVTSMIASASFCRNTSFLSQDASSAVRKMSSYLLPYRSLCIFTRSLFFFVRFLFVFSSSNCQLFFFSAFLGTATDLLPIIHLPFRRVKDHRPYLRRWDIVNHQKITPNTQSFRSAFHWGRPTLSPISFGSFDESTIGRGWLFFFSNIPLHLPCSRFEPTSRLRLQ